MNATPLLRKDCKYRVKIKGAGVIGPPLIDFDYIDTIVHLSDDRLSVNWKNSGCQEVVTSGLEFAPLSSQKADISTLHRRWKHILMEATHRKYSKPDFILFTGLPGSGKSTLARYLSDTLGIFHFDFSEYCRGIFGENPTMQTDYKSIGKIVDELAYEYLESGYSLIYDTTAINAEIRNHHLSNVPSVADKTLVWVNTPSDVCRQRLSLNRTDNSPDLRVGVFRSSIDYVRTFDDFVSDFAEPEADIVVMENTNIERVAEQLITAFHADRNCRT